MSVRWILLLLVLLPALLAPATAGAQDSAVRVFDTVRIQIDTGEAGLAGYQLRADFGKSDARIVGIEGGDGPAFATPPHYDPRALRGGEVVLAALAAGDDLPTGRTTVAVLHVESAAGGRGPLELSELVAVGADGAAIEATLVSSNGDER